MINKVFCWKGMKILEILSHDTTKDFFLFFEINNCNDLRRKALDFSHKTKIGYALKATILCYNYCLNFHSKCIFFYCYDKSLKTAVSKTMNT